MKKAALVLLGAALLGTPVAPAQVRLNELTASTNDRLMLEDEQGRLRPGSGVFWTDSGFTAPGWLIGTAPFGYGGAAGLGTNVSALMQNRTPSLFLRRTIPVTPSQLTNEGQLQLRVRFDDGFIAWINGIEVARANTGPPGHYLYADQKAYNFAQNTNNAAYTPSSQPGTATAASTTGITYSLGNITDFLQAGENSLAIQLVNRDPNLSARIDAQLQVVTADAVLDLTRYTFDEANDSALEHRNLGGTITNTATGNLPAGSWPVLAAAPSSGPGWTDLTLRTELAAGQGRDGSGALRYVHSQTDPANETASVSGPPMLLDSQIPAGGLTEADLANLRVEFLFRATANASWNLRLDPVGQSPASSLTGLAPLTATAGTGPNADAPDEFSDAVNGLRTRTISATGAGTTVNSISPATIRNSLNFITGPALRDGIFSLRETNAEGSGTGESPGALEFEVVKSPAVFDTFGFSYQPIFMRGWVAGAATVESLRAGALQFDYFLDPGVEFEVFLESASGISTAADRLGLGTVTGTGSWRTATLDLGSATNQNGFLAFVNSVSTIQARLVFLRSSTLPAGTRMSVDRIGYAPWRTYKAAFSTGTNQAAFIAAINSQAAPQVIPVLEKTGTAIAPSTASVTIDEFALTFTKTNAGTAETLVPYGSGGWIYFPGLAEPAGGLIEPADFVPAGGTGDYLDWIEVVNDGAEAVDLSGWSLSDDPANPKKFLFPQGTQLPAGQLLVVAADGREAPAGAAWLHAPFSLSSQGEFVGLFDPSGTTADALDPGYPEQNPFHSWARHPVTRDWGFTRTATPGEPNAMDWHAGIAAPPEFGVQGGFYAETVTLPLTTATPGATIRYTLDGTEPTSTNGQLYTGPLTLTFVSDRIGRTVRARTMAPGLIPSETVTHTYLINQNSNLRQRAAVLLSGDPAQTFYKPLGIMAISGGIYSDGIWRASPNGVTNYHMPLGDGRLTDPASSSRPYERPAELEIYYPDNRPGVRETAGIRISSSPYSRPRLVLSDPPSKTLWSANATLKPSFNVFFRNDYGNDHIDHPLIPETKVQRFEEFRLRAGKNDISNPFIRDEFIRRLWTDMGHVGSTGTFVSLYINGFFKGFYNLVERIREPFLQSHHQSSADWDVNYIGIFEEGDDLHWNAVLQPRLNANLTVKANWEALREVLDIENVADYFLLNIFSAMWDWPNNNWAMARERTPTGLWRCYVWDAEGAFNMGGKGVNYNTLNTDLLATGSAINNLPLPVMFRRLMTSPEFRLIFADRIQKHLFNEGALTNTNTAPRRAATAAEVAPLMAIVPTNADTSWYTSWTHLTSGRRRFILPFNTPGQPGYTAGHFRDPNNNGNLNDTLWPLTLPPEFGQHGGIVNPGFQLTIDHSAPAGSTIYYTTDGSDPREFGNTIAPGAQAYSNPVTLPSSTTVLRARVRNATTSEWSPLTEARFGPPTVPASAENTVIAEVMYHPPALTTSEAAAGFNNTEDFEYIVLQNIGASAIDITGLTLNSGISLDLATVTRPVIDPGQRLVLAKDATALRFRYGAAIDAVLGGQFTGNLNNAGELLRLQTTADLQTIKAFTYSDQSPWPTPADGLGPSLLLIQPETNPNHDTATSWIASPAPGGQPTGTPLPLDYSQWAVWSFTTSELTNPAQTSPTSDFDGDGWPNLIEFLTGTNPRTPGAAAWDWQVTTNGEDQPVLQINIPRLLSNTGYDLIPESSPDLVTWTAGFLSGPSTPLPNGLTRQQWNKQLPSGTVQQFIRLRAVPTP